MAVLGLEPEPKGRSGARFGRGTCRSRTKHKGSSSSRECVELGRKPGGLLSEVAVSIRDAASRVCPPAKRHAVVVDRDVGVMILRLGELAHSVHEREGLDEVAERKRPLERAVHLAPDIGGHDASIYDRRKLYDLLH